MLGLSLGAVYLAKTQSNSNQVTYPVLAAILTTIVGLVFVILYRLKNTAQLDWVEYLILYVLNLLLQGFLVPLHEKLRGRAANQSTVIEIGSLNRINFNLNPPPLSEGSPPISEGHSWAFTIPNYDGTPIDPDIEVDDFKIEEGDPDQSLSTAMVETHALNSALKHKPGPGVDPHDRLSRWLTSVSVIPPANQSEIGKAD